MSEQNLPTATTPFQGRALGSAVNQGAVAIEQERAIAEAQGQLILAKRFPRDIEAAKVEMLECCKQMSLAKVAFYLVPRGGKDVNGPSIRLAEELARCWGNIEYGHKELSRSDDKSEVLVYAWDKQTNTYVTRQLTIPHVIDTKYGQKPCRDQRDIDDLIANKASKQMRGRILAVMPKWLSELAQEECRKTLIGSGEEKALQERTQKMVVAFAKFSVTPDMIEKWLKHPVSSIQADEFVSLTGIYNALKDGRRVEEYFGGDKLPENEATQQLGEGMKAAATAAPTNGPATVQPTTAASQPTGKPQATNGNVATVPEKKGNSKAAKGKDETGLHTGSEVNQIPSTPNAPAPVAQPEQQASESSVEPQQPATSGAAQATDEDDF